MRQNIIYGAIAATAGALTRFLPAPRVVEVKEMPQPIAAPPKVAPVAPKIEPPQPPAPPQAELGAPTPVSPLNPMGPLALSLPLSLPNGYDPAGALASLLSTVDQDMILPAVLAATTLGVAGADLLTIGASMVALACRLVHVVCGDQVSHRSIRALHVHRALLVVASAHGQRVV